MYKVLVVFASLLASSCHYRGESSVSVIGIAPKASAGSPLSCNARLVSTNAGLLFDGEIEGEFIINTTVSGGRWEYVFSYICIRNGVVYSSKEHRFYSSGMRDGAFNVGEL